MGKRDILIPQNYLSEIHLGILYFYLWNLATLPKCNSIPLIPTFQISCEFHPEANSKKETCSEGDFDKCSFLPCKGQRCQIDNKRFGIRYHEAILAFRFRKTTTTAPPAERWFNGHRFCLSICLCFPPGICSPFFWFTTFSLGNYPYPLNHLLPSYPQPRYFG